MGNKKMLLVVLLVLLLAAWVYNGRRLTQESRPGATAGREGAETAALSSAAQPTPGPEGTLPPGAEIQEVAGHARDVSSLQTEPSEGDQGVVSERDPFLSWHATRGVSTGLTDTAGRGGFILRGILWDTRLPIAVIETKSGETYVISKGESVSGRRVKDITQDAVYLSDGEAIQRLDVVPDALGGW